MKVPVTAASRDRRSAESGNEGLLAFRGTVYPWQLDHMGHMNVMHYVNMFDQATWNLFAAVGLTASFLRGAGRGTAAVDQHLTYARELFPGDTVSVHSVMLEVKERSLRFRHTMRHDESGTTAATCVLKAVYIDSAARKSVALPTDIAARARELLAT